MDKQRREYALKKIQEKKKSEEKKKVEPLIL